MGQCESCAGTRFAGVVRCALTLSANCQPGFRRLVCALISIVACMSAPARGDVKEQFANVCASCHGPEGQGDSEQYAPPIAGQHDWYLLGQMKRFRSGQRGSDAEQDATGAIMRSVAEGLDEKELPALASYIAKLAPAQPTPKEPRGDVTRGRGYFEICSACHASDGSGNRELSAPRLAGLPGWYVTAQLNKFKSGVHGGKGDTASAQQMKPMAEILADESAYHDIIAFLSTVR